MFHPAVCTIGPSNVLITALDLFKSYFSSQNECSGTASTYTWQCTNIPKAPNAAGRWDISRSRCVQKVCTPGPFLANGHFDYPRLVC